MLCLSHPRVNHPRFGLGYWQQGVYIGSIKINEKLKLFIFIFKIKLSYSY